jgi:hypothetical protein
VSSEYGVDRGPPTAPGEADLLSLFFAWRVRWKLILGCAVVCALLALGISLILQPRYTATISLVPASNSLEAAPDSALGGFASALSGLGMSLPHTSSGSDFVLFPQVVDTDEVAARILQRKDILRKLFPREYDPHTGQFRAPRSVGSLIKRAFFAVIGQRSYIPPSIARVKRYLDRYVKVSAATLTSPVATLQYANEDPQFAKMFLLFVYRTVDDQLRTWRVTRARENSEYLERKLNTVAAVDYRAGLLNQLLPQQMIVMMSNPRSAFAARIIDGPAVDDRPDFPNPVVFLLVGLVLGALLIMGLTALEVVFPHAPNPLRYFLRRRGLE